MLLAIVDANYSRNDLAHSLRLQATTELRLRRPMSAKKRRGRYCQFDSSLVEWVQMHKNSELCDLIVISEDISSKLPTATY